MPTDLRPSLLGRFFRRHGKLRDWVDGGCTSPPPPYVKMRIVRSYLAGFGLDNFVETGTFMGDTLAFIADTGVDCTSIELSGDLFDRAVKRFSGRANVRLCHGDSGTLLTQCLRTIDRPTLFWLDGHYSGGATARGSENSPISKELKAVLDHPIKKHVILIDDARCFDGTGGYPRLLDLLRELDESEAYQWELTCDVLRLTPRSGEPWQSNADG